MANKVQPINVLPAVEIIESNDVLVDVSDDR